MTCSFTNINIAFDWDSKISSTLKQKLTPNLDEIRDEILGEV